MSENNKPNEKITKLAEELLNLTVVEATELFNIAKDKLPDLNIGVSGGNAGAAAATEEDSNKTKVLAITKVGAAAKMKLTKALASIAKEVKASVTIKDIMGSVKDLIGGTKYVLSFIEGADNIKAAKEKLTAPEIGATVVLETI